MNPTSSSLEPRSLVRLAAFFYAALFALGAAIAAVAGNPLFFRTPAAAERGVAWLPELAIGLGAAAAVIALSAWFERHTDWAKALAEILGATLGPLRTGHCLILAALSGIAEEALFRGALQPLVGLVPASLLFALAHFAPRRELWPWTLFSLVAGLLLGGIYDWTGTLVAPVVAHAGINAVNLRRLTQQHGAPGGSADGSP